MDSAHRARLADGRRWHFQHGPIDLILEAFGDPSEVDAAHAQAWRSFEPILPTLVEELSVLRRPIGQSVSRVNGPVARRMMTAVWPHRQVFVTPMAAVAGAVAEEVLDALVADRNLERAYVNNGGDIALFLAPGQRFETGIVSRLEAPNVDGAITVRWDMPIRGIATSGRGGRSWSLGIADAVTVAAKNAAAADVAATLIGNAVDVAHPAIQRLPATELDPDSDLGDRLVTLAVGPLEDSAVDEALDRGAELAEAMRLSGKIEAAVIALGGRRREIVPSLARIECRS